ncbi:MAG: Holliday junction branch migration protein RuvA, partial [Acidimicrobiales bacterium]
MIGSLRGRLLDRGPDGELLIEVGGVGHRVQVTPSTSVTIGELDGEVFVHTHHAVREDSETLYGFATIAERRVFESLISAHGVGPALGLAILSVHGPDALRRAVAEDDVAALCLVPGVGKKTAARLVMELKSKLDLPEGEIAVPSGDGGQASAGGDSRADVRTALEGLGYGADEIHAVLVDLPAEGDVGG